MNDFYLKDLNNNGCRFTMYEIPDGDIELSIIDETNHSHSVRIGMGPNSGDPNSVFTIEDMMYLKGALRNLLREFKYFSGEISEDEINRYRNAPKVNPIFAKWFDD